MNEIKITEKDLIGDIAGFPIEVVRKMVEEQVRQGNKADVKVFQERQKTATTFGPWSLSAKNSMCFLRNTPNKRPPRCRTQKMPPPGRTKVSTGSNGVTR